MKTNRRASLPALAAAAVLAAAGCRSPICPWCGHDIRDRPPATPAATFLPAGAVHGLVTTLERGELHPMARAVVRLYDVTIHAGDEPKLVAETVLDRVPTLPAPFRIEFPAGTVDEAHDYLVSAQIVVGTSVLFETDTKYPVLTHGAPDRLQLVLARKKQP